MNVPSSSSYYQIQISNTKPWAVVDTCRHVSPKKIPIQLKDNSSHGGAFCSKHRTAKVPLSCKMLG